MIFFIAGMVVGAVISFFALGSLWQMNRKKKAKRRGESKWKSFRAFRTNVKDAIIVILLLSLSTV